MGWTPENHLRIQALTPWITKHVPWQQGRLASCRFYLKKTNEVVRWDDFA